MSQHLESARLYSVSHSSRLIESAPQLNPLLRHRRPLRLTRPLCSSTSSVAGVAAAAIVNHSTRIQKPRSTEKKTTTNTHTSSRSCFCVFLAVIRIYALARSRWLCWCAGRAFVVRALFILAVNVTYDETSRKAYRIGSCVLFVSDPESKLKKRKKSEANVSRV